LKFAWNLELGIWDLNSTAMKSPPRLVVAAVLLAASTAGRAQTIADLPDDKFKPLVEKAALYAKPSARRAPSKILRSLRRLSRY
jgi:hypothetical protein